MPKKRTVRKSYPVELKKKAVEMSNQPGMTVSEVASQLDVSAQQLSQWRSKINGEAATNDAKRRLDALEENKSLKEQLKQARLENEILKKAAVYFASQK